MLPDKLEILVEDHNLPCVGVLVNVVLIATRKNNFHSFWGPTNDEHVVGLLFRLLKI
jgi:hypothetical protein